MPEDEPADDDQGSGVDYRQLSFVLVAIVGLAIAAFLAPPVPDRDGGNTQGGDSPDAGSDLLETVGRILRYLFDFGGQGEPACEILLSSDPVPGDEVTVTIRDENEPVTDAVVWFTGERIGRTNQNGRVTGEVPYTRQLTIRVEAPSLSACQASTETGRPFSARHRESTAREKMQATISGASPTSSTVTPSEFQLRAASEPWSGTGRVQSAFAQDDNGSATVQITGEMTIEVQGRPYPGETVTIDAEIRDVPVHNGTVEVAGEEVGETDENGQLQIEVPDQFLVSVTVSKGEFSKTEKIDALKLQPILESESTLLVPQGDATVVATRADEQVSGAVVSVDGERVGTTNSAGARAVVLPLDPTAEVTVSTDRQAASVSLLDIYWLPAVLAVVFVSVISGGAYRLAGWLGPLSVVGVFVAILTTLLVEAYLGRTAGLLTLAGFAVLGLVVGLYVRRSAAVDAASEATGLFARLVEWLVRTALQIVAGIEPLLDSLGELWRRFVAWLRSLPRSTSALLNRLLDWLQTLPHRIADLVTRLSTAPAMVALGLFVLLAPVGGYLIDGVRGSALAILALLLAGAAWWYSNREPAEPDDAAPTAEPASSTDSSATTSAGHTMPEPLRELWRRFARRVAPGRWRTRSPAEVGRAARRKGYPDQPVEELTETFREVEYGNRSLSDAVTERARKAYQTLVDDRTDRDGGTARDANSADGAAGRPESESDRTGPETDTTDDHGSRGDPT